jgi:hypothetical protein
MLDDLNFIKSPKMNRAFYGMAFGSLVSKVPGKLILRIIQLIPGGSRG